MGYAERWTTVDVEIEDGIAWVALNRPDKRNAMSPTLNAEMVEVLLALDADDDCGVLVLTGAGDSWSAGMDLKEYFREVDGRPDTSSGGCAATPPTGSGACCARTRSRRSRWSTAGASAAPSPRSSPATSRSPPTRRRSASPRSTGASRPAASSARRSPTPSARATGLLYVMTGRTFDGQQAAAMGLVNASVPLAELRARSSRSHCELLAKNPVVLRAAKLGFKHCGAMSWDQAEDYLYAKLEQSQFLDTEHGREQGLEQFLDEKRIKPGLQTYERPAST